VCVFLKAELRFSLFQVYKSIMQIHDLASTGHRDKTVLVKLSIKCWFNGMHNWKLSSTSVSRI